MATLGEVERKEETTQIASVCESQVLNKRAMIMEHKDEWPTIESDISEASRNGLSAAKVDPQGWCEDKALRWAKSKGKLNPPPKASVLSNAMHNLTGKKHDLKK
jgi:hypothetical protein